MPVGAGRRAKAAAVSWAGSAQASDGSGLQALSVDFKQLWRKLKAEGWTSKRPTGLATVWSYFAPTTSPEAPVEGVNMFQGEYVWFVFSNMVLILIIFRRTSCGAVRD